MINRGHVFGFAFFLGALALPTIEKFGYSSSEAGGIITAVFLATTILSSFRLRTAMQILAQCAALVLYGWYSYAVIMVVMRTSRVGALLLFAIGVLSAIVVMFVLIPKFPRTLPTIRGVSPTRVR